MSLLLDALKKAAKDKQNAADENEKSAQADNTTAPDTVEETIASHDEAMSVDVPEENAVSNVSAAEETVEQDDTEFELSLEPHHIKTNNATVSDEALQMLVFKTNREHRRKQKIIWASITATSVFILLLGGYYFYTDMVKDIEALERKHRIALQKVNAEVIKRKNPELLAELTQAPEESETDINEVTVDASVTTSVKAETTASAPASTGSNVTASKVSITKNQFQDPVSVMLDTAWRAYNKGNYAQAQKSYSSVLQKEKNNRDALLGAAAIAVKQNQTEQARSLYARLLQRDPRDPIAYAALATLEQQAVSSMSESKLKLLLKQQPQAAHINFALGNIFADKKAWPEAQQYYFNAWQSENTNPDYAFNLAVSLDQLGKTKQAVRFYTQSIELAVNRNHSFSVDAAQQRLNSLSSRR